MNTKKGVTFNAAPSFLYVPGNQPRKMNRAFDFDADAIMFELEDAVPKTEKATARAMIKEKILECASKKKETGAKIAVRINGLGTGEAEADLEACVQANLDIVKVTKINDPSDVTKIDGMITYLEKMRGIEQGSIEILPEVDNARGVMELKEICGASSRITCFQLGGGQDYCNDLGVEVSEDMAESRWAREYGVLLARQLGLDPPLHGSVGYLQDVDRRTRLLTHARTLGYQGASCIDPKMVALTNEIFSPTPAKLAWAERVIAAYQEAERAGVGTTVLDGEFIDEAHFRGARDVLNRARAGRPAEGTSTDARR